MEKDNIGTDIKKFNQFLTESKDESFDRTDLKSDMFYVVGTHKKDDEIISTELKPYRHNKVDKIYVNNNRVVFYDKNTRRPIDEIKDSDFHPYTNSELSSLIEDRLSSIK